MKEIATYLSLLIVYILFYFSINIDILGISRHFIRFVIPAVACGHCRLCYDTLTVVLWRKTVALDRSFFLPRSKEKAGYPEGKDPRRRDFS